MRKRTHLVAVGLVALGSALGYAAASGLWNPFPRTEAANPPRAGAGGGSAEQLGCCGDGSSRGELAALAGHNEAVAARAQASGKKKIFNLFQDPFERADITSNTYWDWNLNHVGAAYGMMDEVFKFVASFDEYPPRAFPPSFNPANLLEQKLREIKAGRKLREAFPLPAAPAKTPKE